MGHVECPQSEPANNDLQPGRSWMVAATNCERVGDQSRNGRPVSAAGKTGHFDRRVGAGRRSRCESLAEVIGAKLEVGLSARRIYQDLVEQNEFRDSYQSVQRLSARLKRRSRDGFGAWKLGLARNYRSTSAWAPRSMMERADHEGVESFVWS